MNLSSRDLLHCNPGNWKLGVFYFCRADPRVIVPKRVSGLGWTLNFARPLALPFLAFILAAVYGLADLSSSFQPGGDPRSAIILLLSLTVLALVYRLAKTSGGNARLSPDHDPVGGSQP